MKLQSLPAAYSKLTDREKQKTSVWSIRRAIARGDLGFVVKSCLSKYGHWKISTERLKQYIKKL